MTEPSPPSRWPCAVRESEPLLRALVDCAAAAFFVKDLEGRYLLANRRCRELLRADGAIEGKTDYDLFDRAQADALLGPDRQVIETGAAVGPAEVVLRGARSRTCLLTKWPLFDREGNVCVVCGMAIDITERKRAELDVEKTQRKFQQLVGSIDGIVWEVDAATFEFTYVSPQAERLLGYPLSEWFETPNAWIKYLHPEDRDAALSFCQAETRACRAHSFQYRMIAADGRVVWLRDIVTVIADNGAPVTLCGVMVDVSEVRATEERLRQSERRLELALEGAELYFWELDLRTMRADYAPDFPALLGYAADEIEPTVEAWARLIHPEDLPAAMSAWQEHMVGRAPSYQVEFRIRTRQASWKWLQVRGKVVERDSEGRPLRVCGTDLDVTERKAAEDAVRESEERFRTTFEQAAVGMAHFSAAGHCLRANRRFAEMLLYAPEELVGKHYSELTHADDVARVAAVLERMSRGEVGAVQLEKRYKRKDGFCMWGQTTISTLRGGGGGTRYFNVVCSDVTERIESERRLHEAQSKLQLATSIARVGFWEHDLKSDQVFFSPEWKRHLGYEDGELPNRYEEWASRVHPDDREMVSAHARHLLEQPAPEHHQFEYRLRHKDGGYRWILSRMVAHRDAFGEVVKLAGTHLDVTEHKAVEDKIRQASQHDPLTGLPNRALIYEFGEHLLAAARRDGMRAAVLFIDLDRFKPINDTYGHDVGDKVLKEVARRLCESVRGEDLVGRLGGDEFLAVLSRVSSDADPVRVAANMRNGLARPCSVDGLELEVSPSIGISLFPQDGQSIEALIKNADTAMFHAKEGGRNNYQFFRPELNERLAEALDIENRLKRGLDDEEFVLFYQPIVDTANESVVGAEALIRWPAMHIGPDRFIPVAETAGFMQSLGTWVLREACRQQKEWQALGLPAFPVAVNVSATQFRQKSFFTSVCDAIAMGALAPGDLHVEVTESAVMKNVDEAAATLHSLRELGVKVALDDFGTGYSSLSYLRWLPIDILKVDQSFVRNLTLDPASLAIAEAIIGLGDTLGLEIIAEGVESADTASLLKTRHCRRGQGFYYCRPIPASEFERWYRAHEAPDKPRLGERGAAS